MKNINNKDIILGFILFFIFLEIMALIPAFLMINWNITLPISQPVINVLTIIISLLLTILILKIKQKKDKNQNKKNNKINKKIIIRIIVVIAIITIVLSGLNFMNNNNNIYIELNKEFNLKKNEKVYFYGNDKQIHEIKLIKIVDNSCPQDVNCIWEGEFIVDIKIDGVAYKLGTLSTSEKTYSFNIKDIPSYKIFLLDGRFKDTVTFILTEEKKELIKDDISNKYPEIVAELKKLYGNGNFKIIGIDGAEIDQRDYRPSVCSDDARTNDWQGKYFNDAQLLISTDYLHEPFFVPNNICTLQKGFADSYLENFKKTVIIMDGSYENISNPNIRLNFTGNQILEYVGDMIIMRTYEVKNNLIIVKGATTTKNKYGFILNQDEFIFDGGQYKRK